MLAAMALMGKAWTRPVPTVATVLAVVLPGLVWVSSAQARLADARASAATLVRIAYVTAGARSPERVWVANADGREARVLGEGEEPLISPDGSQVAAGLFGTGTGSQETGPSLAVYPTGGAAPLRLGDLSTASVQPLAWSPDSRYLAVALQSTDLERPAQTSGLAVLDMTTGKLTTIATGYVYGASFAPEGSDRIVYGRAPSQTTAAGVNLYAANPDGSDTVRLTSDGRSLNPLWGPHGIAFDRERLRHDDAPEYQIWLRPFSGSRPPRTRRLTSLKVGPLVVGLVPIAFSASGSRLLAEFEGQDTSEAWTVVVPSRRSRRLRVGRGHANAIAGGISRDGAVLLIDEGFLEGPPSSDKVATVPFAGGPAKVIVAHGSQAGWNG
jgi:hypothetical protein